MTPHLPTQAETEASPTSSTTAAGSTLDKCGGPTHDPVNIQQFARIENARSLFQNYLTPGFVASARWDTLELVRARLHRWRTALPLSRLFKVQLEDRTAFIYLLFEHKSYLDPLTGWQLLRQMVHLWHDWLTEPENASAAQLPLILPLVLYH